MAMFEHEFSQLAVMEGSRRTPVLLTEDQYRRAKACVEACDGMTDEQVSHGLVSASVFSSVVNQRDELLAAMKKIGFEAASYGEAWKIAQDAYAKAGGAA